ncbi:hypothetical protein TNCV_1163471 [Trichonephila clavipes]|nr:hypothetical protein TNCV_1163471 [Trichonephila clavipes]
MKKIATKAKQILRSVFGEDTASVRTCQRYSGKFLWDDFSLKDEPRAAKPSNVNDEVLLGLSRTNRTLTSTELGFKLGTHYYTALDRIKMLSRVQIFFEEANKI